MKLYKSILPALMGLVMFSSCEQDTEDYAAGTQEDNYKYGLVAFEKSLQTFEVEPDADAACEFAITRPNKDGKLVLPLNVDGDVDVVVLKSKTAVFEDGDSVAVISADFSNAEIGKTYTIKVSSADASYYCTPITVNVARVKWNDISCDFYSDAYNYNFKKEDGFCAYTEDCVSTFYGVGNYTQPVQVQERDDKPGYFRMINAYGEYYPYNEEGDYDTSKNYYIIIDATNPNQVYIPSKCEQGTDWGYGNFIVWSFAGYYLAKGDPATAAAYYGTYKNGKITFPKGGLLFGMANYNDGGMYGSNNNGKWTLVIDPTLDPHVADLESDFEWEEVFTGSFKSGILGTSSEVTLVKGTCVNKKDNCDEVFAAEYGTAYGLVDPYGANAPIYFGISEDGKVTNPFGEPQYAGFKAYGDNTLVDSEDVYVVINTKASSFTENVVTLNLTFQNAKGTIEYGTADEVLSNITWTKVATGTYTFVNLLKEATAVPGFELYQRDDMPNIYKIDNLFGVFTDEGEGASLEFEWDKATNACQVADQGIGLDFGNGEIWVDEVSDYAGKDMGLSSFDPETNTFNFHPVYYVSAGVYGYEYETFVLDAAPAAAPAKAIKQNAVKTSCSKAIKRANKLIGKRVNIKAIKKGIEATPLR